MIQLVIVTEPSFIISVCLHTAAEDYISKSTSLLFSPRVASAVVDVTIISDSVLESSERFLLSLVSTNDSRVTIQPDRQTTVIEILDTTGEIDTHMQLHTF